MIRIIGIIVVFITLFLFVRYSNLIIGKYKYLNGLVVTMLFMAGATVNNYLIGTKNENSNIH